ncbi:MAG: polysaccharide deacetylase family protein, partial [Candidatus Hodarchaeota archaeon]
MDALGQNGVISTFPITSKILERYPELIKKFSKQNIEFAVHGHNHLDYTQLTRKEALGEIRKAVGAFRTHGIQFSGFRFPYLKWDTNSLEIIRNSGFFKWDSSHTILWDVVDNALFSERDLRNYQLMLRQYNYKSSSNWLCLPKLKDDFTEIPVSLPDDDLLERLGLRDSKAVTEIWVAILHKTHSRGELFTLQLHPERILVLEDSLKSIIQIAKELQPGVWIASMNDICNWWREKEGFSIQVENKANFQYQVNANCSAKATLLVRSNHLPGDEFYNGYKLIDGRRFFINSRKRPVVGIPKNSPHELIGFLKNESFIFEMSEEKNKYSVYLDSFHNFSEKDEKKALEIIHASDQPLIRFWRWPNECKSCLAITGDIDSITLYDFFD